MAGNAAWALVAVLVVGLELVARRRPGTVLSLGRLGALVAVRLPGRVLLFGVWLAVGLHLFARSTGHG